MSAWEDVHAGAVVLGHDRLEYGVVNIAHSPAGPFIVLTRYGSRTTAQVPPGTPITIISQPELSAEARAFATFAGAGLEPQVLRETLNR